jgi:group I intron endonuclease
VTNCGIYVITQTATGLQYVGQSIHIHKRWVQHARDKSGKSRIGRSIIKNGWASFHTAILEICDRESLNNAEAKWVAALNTFSPNGFNLTTGGHSYKRPPVGPETRRKMSASRTGIKHTDQSRANMAAAQQGKFFTAETRALISKTLMGSKLRPESIIKRTTTQALNRLLHPPSAEACAALSAKRSAIHKGKIVSAETGAKISAAKKGKKPSPEMLAQLKRMTAANVLASKTREKQKASPEMLERLKKMAAANVGTKQTAAHIAAKLATRQANKAARQPLPNLS